MKSTILRYFIIITFLALISKTNDTFCQQVLTTIPIGPKAGNGMRPTEIASNPVTNRIYVSNRSSENISIIDGLTNKIIDTISLNGNVKHLAVNHITNRIYVYDSSNGNICVIDGADNKVIDSVEIGMDPREIVVNPVTNCIYVSGCVAHLFTRFCVGFIKVVDGDSNEIIRTIRIPIKTFNISSRTSYEINDKINYFYRYVMTSKIHDDIYNLFNRILEEHLGKIVSINTLLSNPLGIDVNPKTNRIYAVDNTTSSLIVIDGDTNRILDIIRIKTGANDVDVNISTNRIYVTHSRNNHNFISIVNGQTNKVIDTIIVDGPIKEIAINNLTNLIYVSTILDVDKIFVIDGNTNEIINAIEIEDSLNDIIVTPATNTLYAIFSNKNTVLVIDGTTSNISKTITIGVELEEVAVNYTSNTIYAIESFSNKIFVINGNNGYFIDIVELEFFPSKITVNSITNRIYIKCAHGNDISVMDGATNEIIDKITVANSSRDSFGYGFGINTKTNIIYATVISHTDIDSRSRIVIIDGNTNQIINTIKGSGNIDASSIEVNVMTNKIYVTDINREIVYVVDGNSNKVIDDIAIKGLQSQIALNLTTNRIYVLGLNRPDPGSNYQDLTKFIGVVDSNTNELTNKIVIRGSRFNVNPTTNRIYVANAVDNNVDVIDGITNKIVKNLSVGVRPINVGINPVTNRIYIANKCSGDLTVIQDELR